MDAETFRDPMDRDQVASVERELVLAARMIFAALNNLHDPRREDFRGKDAKADIVRARDVLRQLVAKPRKAGA